MDHVLVTLASRTGSFFHRHCQRKVHYLRGNNIIINDVWTLFYSQGFDTLLV